MRLTVVLQAKNTRVELLGEVLIVVERPEAERWQNQGIYFM